MGEHKQPKQVYDINLSPRERWSLANLLLTGVEIKGELDRKRFNRAFDALSLDEFFETVEKRAVPPDAVLNAKARSYGVTAETADFLKETIDKTGLSGMGARLLGKLLERMAESRGRNGE